MGLKMVADSKHVGRRWSVGILALNLSWSCKVQVVQNWREIRGLKNVIISDDKLLRNLSISRKSNVHTVALLIIQ